MKTAAAAAANRRSRAALRGAQTGPTWLGMRLPRGLECVCHGNGQVEAGTARRHHRRLLHTQL
eukprot:11217988-Lingulodinium_polyedra.AAC.1